jgi:hypothetical protein
MVQAGEAMNDFDKLNSDLRRYRMAVDWVERGGWQVWCWGLPVLALMIGALAFLGGRADERYQARKAETPIHRLP